MKSFFNSEEYKNFIDNLNEPKFLCIKTFLLDALTILLIFISSFSFLVINNNITISLLSIVSKLINDIYIIKIYYNFLPIIIFFIIVYFLSSYIFIHEFILSINKFEIKEYKNNTFNAFKKVFFLYTLLIFYICNITNFKIKISEDFLSVYLFNLISFVIFEIIDFVLKKEKIYLSTNKLVSLSLLLLFLPSYKANNINYGLFNFNHYIGYFPLQSTILLLNYILIILIIIDTFFKSIPHYIDLIITDMILTIIFIFSFYFILNINVTITASYLLLLLLLLIIKFYKMHIEKN